MTKTTMILCCLIAGLLALGACGSGGSSLGNQDQHLISETYNVGGQERQLKLRGPSGAASQPVTYYIFGSNDPLADGGMVPLQSQRLGEKAFGPYSAGQPQVTVDLSEWAAYPYLYVRAIPVNPNKIVYVAKGSLVDLRTS
jgi:hypothetical protein